MYVSWKERIHTLESTRFAVHPDAHGHIYTHSPQWRRDKAPVSTAVDGKATAGDRQWWSGEMEIAGCGVVKWLGHYSSAQTILVVGDGDLSFSLALATAFDTGDKLVATSLDTYDALTSKYGNAKSNVAELKRLGATVLHCVDAKTMKHHRLNMRGFDRIVFNFPHAGIKGDENDDHMINAHQFLVRRFFLKASHLLRPDGEIHISHNRGQYYRWKIPKLASECSLVMVEIVAFRQEDYPGYNRKRGYGDMCDEEFPLRNGWTSKFRVRREEAEDDTFSTAAQREGEKKMITLKSSDCEEFEVEEAVAMESQTIRHMIEDDYADNGILHPNVNSKILYKVIEYCYKHVHATAIKPANSGAGTAADTSTAPTALAKDLKNWDDEFANVDQATFFDLILAQLEEERRLREEDEAAWAVELQKERAARAAQEEEQRTAWAAQEEVNKNLQEQLQMLRQSITGTKHTPPPPPLQP